LKLAKDPILAKRMEKKYQLEIEVAYDPKKKEIVLGPSKEGWISDIKELITFIIDKIAFVPCFTANEVGSAREDNKIHIFQPEENYVAERLEEIEAELTTIFRIPEVVNGLMG